MKNYQVIETLTEAYGTSTKDNNKFEKAIKSIKWNDTFQADGETYFLLDGLTLTVENLDPFKEAWKPTILVANNMITLGYDARTQQYNPITF